jgi:hypothetical protein
MAPVREGQHGSGRQSVLGFGRSLAHTRHNAGHPLEGNALGDRFGFGDGSLDQPLCGAGGLRLFGQKSLNLVHDDKNSRTTLENSELTNK